MNPSVIFISVIPFFIVLGIFLALPITSYILGAIGVQKIAQRRGAQGLWRAWVPIARQQLLGELSDWMPEKQPACRKYSWRKWYPLAIAVIIGGEVLLTILSIMLYLIPLVQTIALYGTADSEQLWSAVFPAQLMLSMFSLLLSAVQIGYRVLEGFILYPVYMRYARKGAMALAICGSIFGIHSFFLFAIRNRMEEPIFPAYTMMG